MEQIYVGLISGVVTLVVCLINNHFQKKEMVTLIAYRLEQLEKAVSKHNNLVDRMYKAERDIDLHEERITQLEKKE